MHLTAQEDSCLCCALLRMPRGGGIIGDKNVLGAGLSNVSITSEAGARQIVEAVVEAVLIDCCLVVAAAV